MYKYLLLCLFSFSITTGAFGQKKMSWKKLRSDAEQNFQSGNYAEAATLFEQAWEKKSKKKDLIYRAGESYYLISDYRKAASAYQHVKDQNEDYPLVGLKYARSLKQDAQYDKAKKAFQEFLDGYGGQGRNILEEIIRKEVMGCELAAKLPLSANRSMSITYAGSSVNSEANEFGATIHTGDLYFSSDRGGKARIYQANNIGAGWSTAVTPSEFPVIKDNYAYPAISPDGSRLYFNICNSGQDGFNELKSRCELFTIRKTDAGWGRPERLPDYVNMTGVTAMMPSVVQENNQEVIYFASNREGGRGGLDIWMITRDLSSDDMEYTFPVNLGPSINSIGDEITPFFDAEQSNLYFSSNGHVSIGGYDVFMAQGSETAWTTPKNAGLPINSSANDYGYYESSAIGKGLLVSNRVSGGEKPTTRHNDIFYFDLGAGGQNLVLKGDVFDKTSGAAVPNFTVSLYQVANTGEERLLIDKAFTNGLYELDLLANNRFLVVIKSTGYQDAVFDVATNDPNQLIYGQPVYMESALPFAGEPAAIGISDAKGNLYTARATSPEDNLEYVTNAPRYDGVYYKIQLAALSQYKDADPMYTTVKELGRIDTEKLVGKNLTRILLSDFFTSEEAFSNMGRVKNLGFNNAFVVKYEDGVRYGKINQ